MKFVCFCIQRKKKTQQNEDTHKKSKTQKNAKKKNENAKKEGT